MTHALQPSEEPRSVPPDLADAADRAARKARTQGSPVLLCWTERQEAANPFAFLAASDTPRAFFAEPGTPGMAGAGVAVRVDAAGPGRFDTIRLQAEGWLEEAVVAGPPDAPPPRFMGGFAFRDEVRDAAWDGFPAASFVLPAVTVLGPWVCAARLVEGREDASALARHVAIAAHRAARPARVGPLASPGAPLPAFGSRVVDRVAWIQGVENALHKIRRGPLRKVVLARTVAVPLTAPLAGPAALARLAERYADCFLYLVEPAPGRAFLGATPELLARVRGRAVESAAVAGSAPRGATTAVDDEAARALRANPKERREHDFVVEHVRSALASLGGKIRVAGEPGLLRLRNVQHLHTPIQAEVGAATPVLEVAAALHPTPAIGGTPVREALDFIAREEGFDRGWYSGAVGWFDGRGDGTFAVALRCALLSHDEARLFAGAGIVAGAEPEREWQETLLKLQPMLEALGCPP